MYAIRSYYEKMEDEASVVEILEYEIPYGQGHVFGAPRPIKASLMEETAPPREIVITSYSIHYTKLYDIIIAMNQTVIKNNDNLASYLEQYTLPGDNIDLSVMRANVPTELTVTLGTRPAPSS